MGKMYLNVIHRADRGKERMEALKFQQDEAHKYGFKTTLLASYQGLIDSEMIAYMKEQHESHGDELGIHLMELMCEEFVNQFDSKEIALYMYSMDMKEKILTFLIERFIEVFGFEPQSIGAYILDANTIRFLKKKYPFIKTAIINCFEEGVKMYHGNNHSWYLFSDGGPWGAYYPSDSNHLIPAADEDDEAGIVGLPHLNRDMLMSLTSRDDLFASHPVNLLRAKINDGDECNYMYHFIDQWIYQAQYNKFSYYNLFVSSPWVAKNGSQFEGNWMEARGLYSRSLAYLRQKADEGTIVPMTMNEFGEWYRANIKPGAFEVNLWKDILCGSKRTMFWYADSYMRVALDPYLGGTITDLRPYAGKLEINLGPDTEQLWNGNFPYLISIEHRGAMWNGPYHTCFVSCDGYSASVYDKRTSCKLEYNSEGRPMAILEPVIFKLGNVTVKVKTVVTFEDGGRVIFERQVAEVSEPGKKITLQEVHKGTYGTTEYPENMKGIVLAAHNGDGSEVSSIEYLYKTRSCNIENPGYLTANIPQVKTKVSLIPMNGADSGGYEEGCLFSPYYYLRIQKTVEEGGSLKTCLEMKKA